MALRTAVVLGRSGGVFPVLRRLAAFGLGGTMADGRQFVSWIHEADFCESIAWLIANDSLAGPVNISAPEPIPNGQMMKALLA